MRRLLSGWIVAAVLVLSGDAHAESGIERISPSDFETILKDELGNVVILNLWATWCAPCIAEIPDLITLEQEFADENLTLIGISMDEPSMGTAKIEDFRTRFFPSFRTYARDESHMDNLVSVVDPTWNEVMPTTYLIRRDGTVAMQIQGKKSLEDFRGMIAPVVELQ